MFSTSISGLKIFKNLKIPRYQLIFPILIQQMYSKIYALANHSGIEDMEIKVLILEQQNTTIYSQDIRYYCSFIKALTAVICTMNTQRTNFLSVLRINQLCLIQTVLHSKISLHPTGIRKMRLCFDKFDKMLIVISRLIYYV